MNVTRYPRLISQIPVAVNLVLLSLFSPPLTHTFRTSLSRVSESCVPMLFAFCSSLDTIQSTNDTIMRSHLFNSRACLVAVVFVIFVCHGTLAQSADDNIVSVDVYYESLCSDSMRWIVNQLVPSYPELKNFIHVTLVPYGKATHNRESETGPWQFVCQHGPAECRGNKAQACGIHAIETSEEAQNHQQLTVKLVGCVMSARNPATAVPQCAQDVGLSEKTQKSISDCISSPLADDLLVKNGDKTNALEPPLKFVPTIVINKVHSKENQEEALNNFPNLICRHLTAQKPKICEAA